MSNGPIGLADFWAEMRRRRVFRVALAYLVVGIAVIEVANNVVPALGIPDWAVSLTVLLTLLGFPIALVLGWAYDVTPHGVVRTDEATMAPQEVGSRAPSRLLQLGLLSIVAVVVATPLLRFPASESSNVAGGGGPLYVDSIAVMPLDNLTGSAEFDHFGLGITDEIINQLSRIAPLKITPRYSVETLAQSQLTTRGLASELGVRHVLQGSILVEDDRLRATVYQVDASTDAVVWSDSFSGPLDDLVGAQERIARGVIDRVLDEIPGLPSRSQSVSLSAGPGQSEYLLGSYWLNRRTPEGLQTAVQHLSQAIVLQPEFARAYADLSSAYALSLVYRYDLGIPSYRVARRSLEMADRAVQLDPEDAAGYGARGYVRAILSAPTPEVISDFQRASQLRPNDASVASWSARALVMEGRSEEALFEAERAVLLDPLSAARHLAVAYLSLRLGDFDRAVESAQRSSALEPELMLSRAIEARALLLRGDAADCLTMDLGPHAVLRATCLWETGDQASARVIADSVTALVLSEEGASDGFTDVVRLEDLAVFHAWQGHTDETFEWITRAYDLSPEGVEIRVYDSALFDRVRTDEFVTQVGALREELYRRVERTGL